MTAIDLSAMTVIALDVPVIAAVTLSVAVIVCVPVVKSVAEKVPTPFVSFEAGGSCAESSELLNCTVPV